MIFDTHAHYDDAAFEEDRDMLLASMRDNGIKNIVNVGADLQTSANSVMLAQKYDFMYAAVGVHPSDTKALTEQDMETLAEYTKKDKVAAIGEIGLDYHYEEPDRETQQKWFIRQLALASELKMPIIVHSRDAAEDTFRILKSFEGKIKGGVIHCYSYSPQLAREFVKLGYFIGIGGVVTFKNSRKLKETVIECPLRSLVLETDCPYLAPEPDRGKRNDSSKLKYVVSEVARLKEITEAEVIETTYRNGLALYGLEN